MAGSLAAGLCVTVVAAADAAYPISDLAQLHATDRLLIVAPHPDDETLCCAGVIYQATMLKAGVAVLWLTSGDAFELAAAWAERTVRPGTAGMRSLGMLRMSEARRAAGTLGVPAEQQLFLGFPDRGLLPLLLDHVYVPFTSPYTGLSAVAYDGAVARGLSYEGHNLEEQLRVVLDRWQPTFVLAPSPLDTHEDHRAAGSLVLRVMGPHGGLERIRYWIVHDGMLWPWPGGWHPDERLSPPADAQDMRWESVPLSDAARAHKRAALETYQTQMFGLERRFLLSFVRSNELFARKPLPARNPPPR